MPAATIPSRGLRLRAQGHDGAKASCGPGAQAAGERAAVTARRERGGTTPGRPSGRELLCAAGFSLPLSLCLVLGYQLEATDHITPSPGAAVAFLLLCALLLPLCAWSFRLRPRSAARTQAEGPSTPIRESAEAGKQEPLLDEDLRRAAHQTEGDPGADRRQCFRRWLLTWLAIVLPNLVVLLGVYPGFFVYDAQDELMEVVTRSFNTHHPLAHVLALGGTVTGIHKLTGSWNLGIFVYLLLQLLLIAAIDARVVCQIARAGLPRPLCAFSIAWYALFPTVVMYQISSTKDGLFAAFTTLYLAELYELLRGAGRNGASRSHYLVLTAASTAMMLFRNNASYVIVLMTLLFALLALTLRKERRSAYRRLLLCSLLSLAAYLLLNQALILATHASHNEHQESITVAIQTLGRAYTYHPEAFTAEDRAVLLSYLSEEGLAHYEPRNSDFLKSTFNNDRYCSDPRPFWRLWLRIGGRCPMTYLNGWLLTSYGLWYPFAVNNVYVGHTVFTFTYTESSYFGYETELPGVRRPLIPAIDAFYRWLSLDDDIQRIPLLSLFFAPAAYFWLYVWHALRRISHRRALSLIPLLPLLLLWLTHLIGPSYLVRYTLPLFMFLPLFLADALCDDTCSVHH